MLEDTCSYLLLLVPYTISLNYLIAILHHYIFTTTPILMKRFSSVNAIISELQLIIQVSKDRSLSISSPMRNGIDSGALLYRRLNKLSSRCKLVLSKINFLSICKHNYALFKLFAVMVNF